MISNLYLWIYLPDALVPVVAGKLALHTTAAGPIGHFNYGKSYLARAEAIPLDPVVLPLKEGEFIFAQLKGFPGVVLDACPDAWGMRVIDQLQGKQLYPQGYLLLNDPGRSGALAFSLSATEAPIELCSQLTPLADLLQAARALEQQKQVAPELLKALHPGTGGARPKCSLTDAEGVWLAKFSCLTDNPLISIPRLEHACMMLGHACGVHTAKTRLLEVSGQDVCLVKRFDRRIEDGRIYRRSFVSARTVFYADPAYHQVQTGSYARLARWLGRYGCSMGQGEAVFRRMVFNCIVRNTDDHELNHGFVHVEGDAFQLAPAYDIVPDLRLCSGLGHPVRHALLIGDSAAGSVSNLISNAGAFGLTRDRARAIIYELEHKVSELWLDCFYTAGFGDREIHFLQSLLKPLPN